MTTLTTVQDPATTARSSLTGTRSPPVMDAQTGIVRCQSCYDCYIVRRLERELARPVSKGHLAKINSWRAQIGEPLLDEHLQEVP